MAATPEQLGLADLSKAGSADRTEGDVNLSPHREQYWREHSVATQRMLADDAQWFLHQSLSTPCLNGLARAQGSSLFDLEGREILDFHGNSVHQVGYAHPRVVEAVKRQLEELPFCPRRYTNRAAIDLARRLCEAAPVRRPRDAAGEEIAPRALFAPGGAEAIGIALKLVRYATGRFKTVSMWDAFHGATLDAISVGGEALFRAGVGPLLPGCIHVPPYSAHDLGEHSAAYVEYALRKESDVGAVIAEPMRWTTVTPPPPDYWQSIRASCDAHGALLIIDEIPSCLGRTGRMFCCEHFDVEADVIVLGKGLGGGLFPLAAVVARGDLNVAADRALGHYTHEKSSLGAAAALATLDVLIEEDLIARAERLGKEATARLRDALRDCALHAEVRGLGLQLAVELRRDGAPACDEAERILYDCLRRGVSFKVADGNVLCLSPPLTIDESDLWRALQIVAE
ncbi:MAG: aspartate aminotransferase family protein, partial [Planctomycetales bacterium]|nr:aspartate aminotransferase family protein [Planctomycetales bacterium]